ncbi:MAG: hypothetical protein ABIM99_02570 [Candidatus Dojkabacteria bacterium]
MKTLLLLTSLIFVTLLSSCQDRHNISVTGQIVDEATGQPISKAEVAVLCWYMSSIDDASFIKKIIFTDEKGNYKATFDKGHQIDVASKANGYNANRKYNKLSNNTIQVNLKLTKAVENLTLIKYLSIDNFLSTEEDKRPFLRVRIHSDDSSKNLDFKKAETFGFDFQTLRTISDTTNCDFWFKFINKEEQPTVLIANKGGGVIPVYSNEIKTSFFYEKAFAPTTGYLKEYKLKGNEEGFFVLSRDGKNYGKIIFEKAAIDASSPDGKGGFYKDFGKNFSCLYQPSGTNNLSYSTPNIDLENFLVDYRLR